MCVFFFRRTPYLVPKALCDVINLDFSNAKTNVIQDALYLSSIILKDLATCALDRHFILNVNKIQ